LPSPKASIFSTKHFAPAPPSALHQISSVETSQGVLSLLQLNEQPLSLTLDNDTLVIALDGIQDPGNAGTIVRSAEAFGATGVVFLKGSVSPWNPKTLRASAGSLLRLPFALAPWEEFLSELQKRQIPLYSAHPRAEKRIDEVPFKNPAAILIGNEGRGVPAEHEQHATPVRIPTENVESLNAALAAGLLLYEARRQRT
jgi:TrmH family RNA methyltransferase